MSDDQGNDRSPRLVTGRNGRRLFSMAALSERVREEFLLEYAGTPALSEADTSSQRMRLVLGVVDYVIAVESLAMGSDDKAVLIQRVYSELFGYGALDPFFADASVTTIALNGTDHVAVRYGSQDLQELGAIFEDADQLQTVVTRILEDAGVDLTPEQPIVETGLQIGGRRVSVSVISPTISTAGVGIVADIRLHPPIAPTLAELVASEVLTRDAADTLIALARSKYGFVIAGETETGKTTLLNALALEIDLTGVVAIERTGEMRLPATVTCYQPSWGTVDSAPVTFGDRIDLALADAPSVMMIDEVRADEPASIAPLLARADAPRQWWVFRGAPDHKRLQSALGMLARRAETGAGETLVHALYERLPFVVSVARIQGRLRLFSIAEWQSRIDTEYPDYVQLFRYDNAAARRTEAVFARWV
ncbi:MAG: ATPase, T2SS/T4P/T4SS family [Chloroflexota bacterium]|nr:ATPase, T2SS/T4P/T4SS family [Chloroflexota bacterium]